jgi:hypothetical protein
MIGSKNIGILQNILILVPLIRKSGKMDPVNVNQLFEFTEKPYINVGHHHIQQLLLIYNE